MRLSGRKIQYYSLVAIFIFLSFLVASCGEENSSRESGSAIFRVNWVDVPIYEKNDDMVSIATIDCVGAGVAEVSCDIYDLNNSLVMSAGPWNCTYHSAKIDNIPSGYNYRFVIFGQDEKGNYIYRGETPNQRINEGEITDIGYLETELFQPELLKPDISDGAPNVINQSFVLQWKNTSDRQTEGYRLQISEYPDFRSTINDVDITSTTYQPDIFPLGTYYWRVFAFDKQGNESAYSDPVWSFVVVDSSKTPIVTINSPLDNSSFSEGETIGFYGSAQDYLGNALTGSSLEWFSSKDLFLGTGTSINTQLTTGDHTIIFTATDNQSIEASYSIDIKVMPNEWTKLIGSSMEEEGIDIVSDQSGNIYITGWTYGDLDGNINSGLRDIYLMKYSSNGEKLWLRLLGTSVDDITLSINIDSVGNSYITGYSYGDFNGQLNNGLSDCLIAKYDTVGNLQWSRLLGTEAEDGGYGIGIDGNGNSYIAGITEGNLDSNTNAGKYDVFLAKYNTDGIKQWSRLLGSAETEKARSIVVDFAGNCYITGYTEGSLDGINNMGGWDIFIAKFNSSGNKIWVKLLGTTKTDFGKDINLDEEGNIYVTGYTYGDLEGNINAGSQDVFISKYTSTGNKIWTKLLGSPAHERGNGIAIDTNSGIFLVGWTLGDLAGKTNSGFEDIYIANYDLDGNYKWLQLFGTANSDFCAGVGLSLTFNNSAYMIGHTEGNLSGVLNKGDKDIFIMKVDLAQ